MQCIHTRCQKIIKLKNKIEWKNEILYLPTHIIVDASCFQLIEIIFLYFNEKYNNVSY